MVVEEQTDVFTPVVIKITLENVEEIKSLKAVVAKKATSEYPYNVLLNILNEHL